MLSIQLVNLTEQCGWCIGDGQSMYAAGSFQHTSDRAYFATKLCEMFGEVAMYPSVIPLLILCNTSNPRSQQYMFAAMYLEKFLDSQQGMDVDRSVIIHHVTAHVLDGSMQEGYDIGKRFEEAQKIWERRLKQK